MADFNPSSCSIRATIYFAYHVPETPLNDLLAPKQLPIIQTLFSETMANLKSIVVRSLYDSSGMRIEEGDIQAVTRVDGQRFSIITTLVECQDGPSELTLNFFVRLL